MKHSTIALFFVLAPVALHAQTQSTTQTQTQTQTSTTSSSSQGQVSASVQGPTAQARIDAAMQAAVEAKIPTSLLRNKVAEGEAKHVPVERIATAVETRLRALVHASQTLSRASLDQVSAADLAVGADALEAGVTENALISVAKTASEERRVVAMAVVADLVRLGQSSTDALAQVTSALSTSAALASLNAQVANQLKLGGLTSTLDAAIGIVKVP